MARRAQPCADEARAVWDGGGPRGNPKGGGRTAPCIRCRQKLRRQRTRCIENLLFEVVGSEEWMGCEVGKKGMARRARVYG
jgi:hypothetical protein